MDGKEVSGGFRCFLAVLLGSLLFSCHCLVALNPRSLVAVDALDIWWINEIYGKHALSLSLKRLQHTQSRTHEYQDHCNIIYSLNDRLG